MAVQPAFAVSWWVHVLTGAQAHPEAVNPATGPKVPWTSGLTGTVDTMEEDPKQVNCCTHPVCSFFFDKCLWLLAALWPSPSGAGCKVAVLCSMHI